MPIRYPLQRLWSLVEFSSLDSFLLTNTAGRLESLLDSNNRLWNVLCSHIRPCIEQYLTSDKSKE